MALRSRLFRGDPKLEAAAVSGPAHITPDAVGQHVGKIQQALIQIDAATIAGNELSTTSYGSTTADAVLAFKQKRDIVNRSYESTADNIVGVMTMAALDAAMVNLEGQEGPAHPVLMRCVGGKCLKQKHSPAGPKFQPEPDIELGIAHLVPQIRTAIAAAEFRLLAAAPFVGPTRQKLPTGPFAESARSSLKMLDTVFGFSKFDNPRPVLETLRTVYRNMTVALNRSFETDPLIAPVLFVPNPSAAMEKVAVAYTSSGGAFQKPKEHFADGLPSNRIYICSNTSTTSIMFRIITGVHELAHYVSNGKGVFDIDDFLDDDFFDPSEASNVNSENPVISTAAKRLAPSKKIRDAEHYAAFAVLAARGRLQA